jgi:cob(I)alamin adenosyltransferase
MGYRLSKIYTRTGDDGLTNIGDGNRIHKNHARLELLGTLDELNSTVGLLLAHEPETESIRVLLNSVQQELFNVGGELCPPYYTVITPEKVTALEHSIDEWNTTLPPLKEFILPGGNLKAAACHLARTVCRRAERCAVTLHQLEAFNPEILRYLNRLSDALFVAARLLAKETGSKEILWDHDRK